MIKRTIDPEKRTQIILEDMNKKLSLVLEGHVSLDKKIEDLDLKLSNQIEELKTGFNHLNSKAAFLDLKLTEFIEKTEENFKVIMKYLSRIDDELQDIKKRLSSKADIERLEKLEEKIIAIELIVKKHYRKA